MAYVDWMEAEAARLSGTKPPPRTPSPAFSFSSRRLAPSVSSAPPAPRPYDVYDDPRAWSRVPYPYQFKLDAGWYLVFGLIGLGGLGILCQLYLGRGLELISFFWLFLAFAISVLRVIVWLCFRFPLVSTFFLVFTIGLFGGGYRGRRWY